MENLHCSESQVKAWLFVFSWEQRKFSDFTWNAGKRNKDDLDLEPFAITNEHGFIRQSEAHDEFGYMKDTDRKAYNIVMPKSFAYNPARINVGSIGYYEGEENVIVSSLYEVFQTANYVNDRFLWHWFKTKEFTRWIERLQEGSVRLYFYYDKLCECQMFMPSLPEQEKIASTLDSLDNLITLHQRKSKISFSGVVFHNFTHSWEQRKLGDIFKEYSEKNHSELPPLTIVQGKGTVLREESDRNLQYDKANLTGYKLVRKNDFIVHLRSFEGGLEKANTDGIVSPAYHVLHGGNTDTRFYYPFFRSTRFIDSLLKPHVYGVRDGKSIDIEGMKTISIPVPSYEEQRSIGDYIESLDNLITLHQRKRS